MKNYPVSMRYCTTFIVCLLSFFAFTYVEAQVNIDYPSSRAIFQRDKNNSAIIYISGSYTKNVDRIEAKLTAINGGGNVDWRTIHSNPQGGFYSGSINSSGGWYELQVRGMLGDQQVGIQTISPIGIGEVFLIAGQSNAQGFINNRNENDNFDYGVQRANDDRVNCIDFSTTGKGSFDLPYPSFTHLESDTQVSPRGEGAWSWGKLGDLLANRLQVPILFYNVAWSGTIVRSWRESINGTAYSPYSPTEFYAPSGAPYGNMRSVMQYYVPITGIRGVLWLQGEGDNQWETSMDSYVNDLQTVINTNRSESGKNVSWMVSLTSYNGETASRITNAQQKVISTLPNMFTGPNTDVIQIPRTDFARIHFHHEGLTSLAEAWNNQLNDDFFNRSEPYSGVQPLQITASCAGGNVNLAVNTDGFASINWSNGGNSASIQVGNGTYRVTARDGNGNLRFSPEIRIHESIIPAQPQVTLQGSNPVCLGNTATLISNTSENIRWNNGSTNSQLTVTQGGEYFVTTRNVYGCESSSSRVNITILTSPLPEKPTITAASATTFCDGGVVSLRSNSTVNNRWSNGETSGAIDVRNSGEFRVQAVDNFGCYSPASEPVNVRVNPLPGKPSISLNGPANFCEGGNIVLTSDYDNGNIWSNAATSKAITSTQSGTFSLLQRDSNGCESMSDPVTVTVHPLPATPSITTLRPLTFCERDYTTLRSSAAYQYVWSNGGGSQEIDVRSSGDYTISARDQNGCVSPASPAVRVTVNPLPDTPVITANGPTTFCADLSVTLQSTIATGFLWSDGSNGQNIRVTRAGTFSVQTINQFQCYSDRSNEIRTSTLALPPAPSVVALGATMICDGDFVALQASRGSNFIWNSGQEKDSIHVTASGAYSARVRDAQGCFSPYSPEVAVDVKPTPTSPVIRKVGVFTLLAENNLNDGDHVWRLNQTVLSENSATLKATVAGTYSVNNTIVYSPTLTCYSDYSEPFVFVPEELGNGLIVYPNPLTDGKIALETVQDLVNAEVQVIDSRGIIHKTYRVARFDSRQFFDISDLRSGVYIIRVVAGSFTGTQKIVVVR
ncbi:sialate O-acetylesterase [Dyadobacter luteus]|nr:sialate O-acetylesterase [Dyadobacter luteus]